MQMTEIHEEAIQTGFGHSSKGNQLKWLQDGWWYKADAFGFESLAEAVVSMLLERSTIERFVRYEPVMLQYKGTRFRGCRSRNFLGESEELIPLERLSRICTGFSLAQELAEIADTKQRILYTEELVRNVTGITDFGVYLTKILEIDAFFLNEDRHTNNIAVLRDAETRAYRLCPFYDMGLSLFSDTKEDYPLEQDLYRCREKVCAKPFSRDFDEQMDAANELFGSFFRFDFQVSEMMDILSPLFTDIYTVGERKRVEEVLRYQAGKYRYLFL